MSPDYTNENEYSDEDLWKLFTQGNRNAYRILYTRYLNELYSYGYKVIPNKETVSDQIQEVFIDLWKYKENLSHVRNFKHYLFRSLRNKIVKSASKNKLYLQEVEREFQEILYVQAFESEWIENQTNTGNKKKLEKALRALSSRQKEVISLLFYQDLSYEEVSNIMGINVRSVYTLAWKALASLRKHLDKLIVIVLSVFHFQN